MQYRRVSLASLLLFLIFFSSGFGQEKQHATAPQQAGVSVTPLRMAGETKVESDLGHGMSLPKMGEGGFYAQISNGGALGQKIYWINLKGEKKLALDLTRLSLEGGVDPTDLYIRDFAADAQSGLDALVTWEDKNHIDHAAMVQFDSDGDFRRMVSLKINFRPTRFATFLSGNWLLTGYTAGRKDKSSLPLVIVNSDGDPITINNASGTGLLSAFQLPFRAPKSSNAKNTSSDTNDEDHALDALYIASTLLMSGGDDGYVYLYDPVLSSSIYKVASDGSTSKIAVPPPALADNEKLRPFGIHAGYGQVVLEEAVVPKSQARTGAIKIKRTILLVFDTSNGSEVGAYSAPNQFGNLLIGFSPESFYFMSLRPQADHRVDHYIVHATP